MQNPSCTHHSYITAHETWYESYGRHLRDHRKHGSPGSHSTRMQYGGIAQNLRPSGRNRIGKNRKRMECYGCGPTDHFKYEKKCEQGAVRAFQRKRLQEGVSTVHDLIQGMEGESQCVDTEGSIHGNGCEPTYPQWPRTLTSKFSTN